MVFMFCQVAQKHLLGETEKMTHLLIAYFHSNISAKETTKSVRVCLKVIARPTFEFFETQCISLRETAAITAGVLQVQDQRANVISSIKSIHSFYSATKNQKASYKSRKNTMTCGCSPGSVALFICRGNQTCTGICGPGLESLAHENSN